MPIVLLNEVNDNITGTEKPSDGAAKSLLIDAVNFGGGKVTVQVRRPTGQWVTPEQADGTPAEFTAATFQKFDFPGQGINVRAVLSGATTNIPADATLFATFHNSINANYGAGSTVGTPHYGASIVNNKLDCHYTEGGDPRYVAFNAEGNVGSPQVGAIKFKITPNYTDHPNGYRSLLLLTNVNDNKNYLELQIYTYNLMRLSACDSSGSFIINNDIAEWKPVAGTTYEMELNYDFTTGAHRLFIDGVQLGSTLTQTGTRSSELKELRAGSGYLPGDWSIEDFIIFNAVQHTENYTPGYTLPEAVVSNAVKVFAGLF